MFVDHLTWRAPHYGAVVLSLYTSDPVTDAELAVQFRRDPEFFAAVYERHIRDIHRYLSGRSDAQTAEDLAAETFCVAFAHRDRFDPQRGDLRPWLFGIATKLIARRRRKEARHYRALARTQPEAGAESPESRVVAALAAERVRPQLIRALAGLSRGERDVVLLVALAELSYDEVAEALTISPGTVGSRLSRARRKLHNAIDVEDINA